MKYPIKSYPLKNFLKCCINNFILKNPTPLLLSYEITQRCNAKCGFCGYWKLKDAPLGLPLDKIRKIFDEGYDLGCVLLAVTGGEPLLRKDIPEVFRLAKKTGFSTILLTNGYLLSKRIHKLQKFVDSINISVDFPDIRHDKIRGLPNLLERTVEGIRLARNYGIAVNMNCVLTAKHTIEDVKKLMFMAKELDTTVSFEPVFETPTPNGSILGSMRKEDADLLRINDWSFVRRVADMLLYYKRNGFGKTVLNTDAFLNLMRDRADYVCYPFSMQLGIAYNGDVTSMCVLGMPKGYLGNALKQNLKEIWYSEKAQTLREEYRQCGLAKKYGCYLFCVTEPSLPFSNPSVFFEYVKRVI
ncbi:MAG: radical SAM protein [Candidatus Bathyarchaeota archaeon]|nr:radical SAM protein [Candidatus Bathyarchaeota archaeon]